MPAPISRETAAPGLGALYMPHPTDPVAPPAEKRFQPVRSPQGRIGRAPVVAVVVPRTWPRQTRRADLQLSLRIVRGDFERTEDHSVLSRLTYCDVCAAITFD
jgi:hypothetical protein